MIESIIFLTLFFGIPIVMTVLLIRILIRKLRSGAVFASIAAEMGWSFSKSADQHPILPVLEEELFSLRRGKHNIYNLLDSGDGLTICEYRYFIPGVARNRGNRYTLGICPRKAAGDSFWVVRRQEGLMGRAAEAAAGSALKVVTGEEWNWLLSPNPELVESSAWTDEVNHVLKEVLPPGGALFLLKKHIVLSWTGEMDKKRIEIFKPALLTLSGLKL